MRTSLARISLTVLVFVTLLAGVSYIALAVGDDPQTLFTADITSTGPDTTVTEMEQHLLNWLNGATTSIDTAIYWLNRARIRW